MARNVTAAARRHRSLGGLIASIALALTGLLPGAALCAEYHMLALQRDGQASVTIDNLSHTAFIIDLGHAENGTRVLLDGKPLLDALEARGVEHLVIACSHPHSDHMGGIEALFRNARTSFFRGGDTSKPRFKSLTVIDDGVSKSLAGLYQTFAAGVQGRNDLIFAHNQVTERGVARDAFQTVRDLQQEVSIRNLPYARPSSAGVHERSIITVIQLNGDGPQGVNQIIVDFDDADSDAVAAAVSMLRDQGVTKIDAFVVPHHGSRAHDIDPILSLHPTRAIIAVDPANRYGHPSAPILSDLLDQLGPENVLFTGSVDNIVFNERGLRHANFTAATPESYGLFVEPGRARAEALKPSPKRRDDIALYDHIAEIMRRNPGDDFLPDPSGGTPPPRPRDGGGGALAILQDRVEVDHSMFGKAFDAGFVPPAGADQSQLDSLRIFGGSSQDQTATLYAVASEPLTSEQRRQFGVTNTQVRYDTPVGLESVLVPRTDPNDLGPPPVSPSTPNPPNKPSGGGGHGLHPGHGRAEPKTGGAAGETGLHITPAVDPEAHLPNGGMVFLDGGQVRFEGSGAEFAGATLAACGPKLCLRNSRGSYGLPFADSALFQEVWSRVDAHVTTFYLSINPRKALLGQNAAFEAVPTDRLRFGSGRGGAEAFNDVVTSGNIDHARIGEILWRADVAFKTAALGVDAFTGAPAPAIAAAWRDGAINDDDLKVRNEDRWCRLYWTSGALRFSVDEGAGQVRAAGSPLIARAQAMQVSHGDLTPSPHSGWCSREEALAHGLERQANAGSGGPDLARLRELAVMQAFALAAHRSGVTWPNPPPMPTPATAVPTWTSGLRSRSVTTVQEEFAKTSDGPAHEIHVAFNDQAVVGRCVLPNWRKADDDWRSMGLTKDDQGVWELPPKAMSKVNQWATTFAQKIATCSDGRLLKAVNTEPDDDNLDGHRSSLGISLHVLSSQINGGVLLGERSKTRAFETAYAPDGMLFAPDGRLVFRRIGSELHFWNFDPNEPTGALFAQHIVVTDGEVTDVAASDGRLRFVVTGGPGAVLRKEIRARAGGDRVGIEALEALQVSDGGTVVRSASWPCTTTRPEAPCLDSSQAPQAAVLKATRPAGALLDARLIDDNTWLVELDLRRLENAIGVDWKANPDDPAKALSAAQGYAQWGFDASARKALEVALKATSPDSADTLLNDSIGGNLDQESSEAVVLFGYETLDLAEKYIDHQLTADRLIRATARDRDQLARSPAKDAAEFDQLMAETFGELASSPTAKAADRQRFAQAQADFAHQERIKTALTEGMTPAAKPDLTADDKPGE